MAVYETHYVVIVDIYVYIAYDIYCTIYLTIYNADYKRRNICRQRLKSTKNDNRVLNNYMSFDLIV